MPRFGGHRIGSGRKKGSKTKKTSEIARKAAEGGQTPLEYMLEIMRSPAPPELLELIQQCQAENRLDIDALSRLSSWHSMRFEAAKGAAPYIHPRLNSNTVSGPGGGPLTLEIVRFADQTAGK